MSAEYSREIPGIMSFWVSVFPALQCQTLQPIWYCKCSVAARLCIMVQWHRQGQVLRCTLTFPSFSHYALHKALAFTKFAYTGTNSIHLPVDKCCGFCTHSRKPVSSEFLLLQVCKPKDFAMQINLHMENCWGIVRAIIDVCLKLDEGKFIIIKEPNKPVMRLYSVPDNAFEQVSCHDLFALQTQSQWFRVA